jgi:hypothetical protein
MAWCLINQGTTLPFLLSPLENTDFKDDTINFLTSKLNPT